MRYILFLFTFSLFSLLPAQNSSIYYHSDYPPFLGIKGKADSIVIKRYQITPKSFGDTLLVKSLLSTTSYYFTPEGFITKIQSLNRNQEPEKTILYEIKNNKADKILTLNHQESPYRTTNSLLLRNENDEVWLSSYSMKNKGILQDSLFIHYTKDSKRERQISALSGSETESVYTFNDSGFLISKKIITDQKNITLSQWEYDSDNLLISELSGSHLSQLGKMAKYTFFKNTTDSYGNWTERKCYSKKGDLLYLEEQHIYYQK